MKLLKTEKGHAAFYTRSAQLTPRQRGAFVLVDGDRSAADILALRASTGLLQDDVNAMIRDGFLTTVRSEPEVTLSSTERSVPPMKTSKERYLLAKPLATQLSASLGIWGFRLNLAVESALGTEDLIALFPKIQSAVGVPECKELERLLKG